MSNINENPFSDEPSDDIWSKMGSVRKIFLNTAEVCYDKKWYSDIEFWRKNEPCNNPYNIKLRQGHYHKIQFSREQIEHQKVFKGSYLTMVIGLDNNKKISVVETYKILEFLGDWCGFKDFFEMTLSAIGLYFSQ